LSVRWWDLLCAGIGRTGNLLAAPAAARLAPLELWLRLLA